MLSDRCPVLSVTLVYCGQTVGWTKTKLGRRVGLGPGHIVLDGDLASSPTYKGHRPHFSAHVYCGQTVAHLSYCWALVAFGTAVLTFSDKWQGSSLEVRRRSCHTTVPNCKVNYWYELEPRNPAYLTNMGRADSVRSWASCLLSRGYRLTLSRPGCLFLRRHDIPARRSRVTHLGTNQTRRRVTYDFDQLFRRHLVDAVIFIRSSSNRK